MSSVPKAENLGSNPSLPAKTKEEVMKVAFDVDGTLIHQVGEREDTPRYDVISLFSSLERMGCIMYIWSGGGEDYAARWRDKLGLSAIVVSKGSFEPDMAVDDMEVKLGVVNLKV